MTRFAIGLSGFVVNVVNADSIDDISLAPGEEIYEDAAGVWNVGMAYSVAETRQTFGDDFSWPIVTLNKRNQLVGVVQSSPHKFVRTLAVDAATGANTTPITLTGMVFPYEANRIYRIWFMGAVSPAAATTGCGFQFDLSSAIASIGMAFFHPLTAAGGLSGGYSVADDASAGVSSGMPATANYPVVGNALLTTAGSAGTAQLRFRSETNAVVTARAGLTMVIDRLI